MYYFPPRLFQGTSPKLTKINIVSTTFAKLINFEISDPHLHITHKPDLILVFNIIYELNDRKSHAVSTSKHT